MILTKSNYMIGLECPRYLWLKVNYPDKIAKFSLSDDFRMKDGEKVGVEAKKLFPDGIDLSIFKFLENQEKTKEALSHRKPIFEAGFQFNDCFSRADILVPIGDMWDIIEVKASTKTKDVNIHDVAFQKYVYEGFGLNIRKCFIMHLNNEYIRNGNLELDKLFKSDDITEEVDKVIIGIEKRISDISSFMSSKTAPPVGVLIEVPFSEKNHSCKDENCLELPENNVFCLYRGGKTSLKLYENGIKLIKDIPEGYKLNNKQLIQRNCESKGEVYFDEEKISEFINNLKYPLYYLDFETFSTAIPIFNGTKAYSQITFQYSLHVQEKEGSHAEHYEFLYNGNKDPRKDFITSLNNHLKDNGTIIVYNQTFEIGRMKELGENFKEYKELVENIPARTVDLLILFREFSYYNPKQQGSASIKKVLPALTGKTYKGMTISDGGTASVEYFNSHYNKCSEEKRKQVREDLLKYCGLDTEAEIMIIDKLKELISLKEKLNSILEK